jgi:hypothetical protein
LTFLTEIVLTVLIFPTGIVLTEVIFSTEIVLIFFDISHGNICYCTDISY